MAGLNDIPTTQRAAVLTVLGADLQLRRDFPVRQAKDLAPGECLVKMECAGVCHSDLHVKNGDWARRAAVPLVGGHEGVGRVVAIGAHTVDADVKVGDRVGLKWIAKACLRCEMCRKGAESSCMVAINTSGGFQVDGTFAEYVVSFVDYVTPIPDGLDSASATPILCAGLTVYKALKQSKTSVGQWVAIPGSGGGLGHLAVQYAVAMGLRVVAIDSGAEKKELSLQCGAEKWIDYRESKDLVADVKAAADGLGPHAAVIAAGDVRPYEQALQYLRLTGTLVAVGMPEAVLQIPITLFISKSLTLIGSAIGNRQEAIEALDLAARGKVRCRNVIKRLEDLPSIFEDMAAARIAGRVVLRLSDESF